MTCTSWELFDKGKILLVRLNRPKANILDAEMIKELQTGLEERVSPSTRAIILSHSGPHFSFGAAVEEHTRDQAAKMLQTFHGLFHCIHRLSLPFIGVVRGQCLGGGFELASFCHVLLAHPDARFGQPEIMLGVFPPMATLILNLKAPGIADEVNLTGRSFTAVELKSTGLVHGIEQDTEKAAIDYAREHFLAKSAVCLRHAVRANRWRFDEALVNRLPLLEQYYLEELMATQDANEGIGAFLEKRKPAWQDQ